MELISTDEFRPQTSVTCSIAWTIYRRRGIGLVQIRKNVKIAIVKLVQPRILNKILYSNWRIWEAIHIMLAFSLHNFVHQYINWLGMAGYQFLASYLSIRQVCTLL